MSDDKPSLDPVAILLEPGERSPIDKSKESTAAGLVGLAYLAREAFEEKRHKQCLEATKAILKIDPGHKEASALQSSVRTELDQEFVNAQAAARDARLNNDQVLYSRATAALRRIIDVDPDNLEARTLLNDTVAASYFQPAPPVDAPTRWKLKVPRRSVLVGSVAVVVLVTVAAVVYGTGLFRKREPASQATVVHQTDPAVAAAASPPQISPELPANFSLTTPVTNAASAGSLRLEDSDRLLRAMGPSSLPVPRPRPAAVANSPAVAAMGALAVSAAVPVEIYRGEEHLGSTPATLHLAEGPQTLEYRYQGLRQTLTHIITRDQTTTASVSILIKVQINAQPWAQVFIEGANLTPIGQTPLGDISVPIGSVLVFQNPGFPDKRYRVKPTDTAIRMIFP